MSEKKLTHIISDIDQKMVGALSDEADKSAYLAYRQEFCSASRFEKRWDHPVHVDFELTNTCNYRCAFCEHGKNQDQKKGYYKNKCSLPKQKVFQVLEECAKIGVKSVQFNIVDEPLLYPDLIEVLRYAKNLKFPDVFFMTNASLLDKKKSEALMESGLTKIMFSVDALSEQTYQKIRNKKNLYARIVDNIQYFIDLKHKKGLALPLIRISFVISDLNRLEADDFVKFWESRVDFIAMQNLIQIDETNGNNKPPVSAGDYRCNMPYFRLAVRADGRITPCCVFYGLDLVFGNVFEQSLSDVWNSKELRAFQVMHKEFGWNNNPVCKRCVSSTSF